MQQCGAEVMPFNLRATTHIFTKLDSGGSQRVIAKDPSNVVQTRLIRMHLREIQAEFRRGNFSVSARIHCADMPGACIAAFAICAVGGAPDPLVTASRSACVAGPSIQLERYMGKWYVIAETPFLSEHHYVGSYDEWTLRADGKIADKYLGRRHSFDQPVTGSHFVAKVMPGTGDTTWRVGLIWPLELVVVTAYVDADYRYTIRCMADGNMVWMLARPRRSTKPPIRTCSIGLPAWASTLTGAPGAAKGRANWAARFSVITRTG